MVRARSDRPAFPHHAGEGKFGEAGAILLGELLAELKAPLVTENFEGITAFRDASGATRLLLVSDDNFNDVQRTLLLSFEIAEPLVAAKP